MMSLFGADALSAFRFLLITGLLLIPPKLLQAQSPSPIKNQPPATQTQSSKDAVTDERAFNTSAAPHEYRIGVDDVVEINVFDAPEINRKLRVSGNGEISVPLLGSVRAGGLTSGELEAVLESRLLEYMKEPHVGVFVVAVESHPISVLGAVKKPGVFQVRGPKTILEMLSMAEGLSEDAGDVVLVMRGAGSASKTDDKKLSEQTTEASLQRGPGTSEKR